MPLLRGHHLICLHFFNGEGYNETFIKNLMHIMNRVENEMTTVSFGADNICTSCLHLNQSRCQSTENAEEEIREMDKKALELLELLPRDKVTWDEVKEKLPGIFSEWFSQYCLECKWKEACKKNDYFQKLSEKIENSATKKSPKDRKPRKK